MITRGDRIKCARGMTILSRRAFSKKTGISASTLQSWEDNKALLTNKGAKRLATAFNKLGVLVSPDFFMTGKGLPPISTKFSELDWNTMQAVRLALGGDR